MRKLVHPDHAVLCDVVSSRVLLRVTGGIIQRASRSRKVYEKQPKELLRTLLVGTG